MGILKAIKEIKIEDRNIQLYLPLVDSHQMGHVIIHPREQMSNGFMTHKEDEYLYLIKGKLTVKTRTEKWQLKAGEFNMIPKGVEHIVENLSNHEGEFVFFNIRSRDDS